MVQERSPRTGKGTRVTRHRRVQSHKAQAAPGRTVSGPEAGRGERRVGDGETAVIIMSSQSRVG